MLLLHDRLLFFMLSCVFLLLHAELLLLFQSLTFLFPFFILLSLIYSLASLFHSKSVLFFAPLLRALLHVLYYCTILRHLVFSFKIVFQNSCPTDPQHSPMAHSEPLRPVVSCSSTPLLMFSVFLLLTQLILWPLFLSLESPRWHAHFTSFVSVALCFSFCFFTFYLFSPFYFVFLYFVSLL